MSFSAGKLKKKKKNNWTGLISRRLKWLFKPTVSSLRNNFQMIVELECVFCSCYRTPCTAAFIHEIISWKHKCPNKNSIKNLTRDLRNLPLMLVLKQVVPVSELSPIIDALSTKKIWFIWPVYTTTVQQWLWGFACYILRVTWEIISRHYCKAVTCRNFFPSPHFSLACNLQHIAVYFVLISGTKVPAYGTEMAASQHFTIVQSYTVFFF